MSQEPSESHSEFRSERRSGPRWGRIAAIGLGIVVAVYVLFTWVFPWITEIGLSPAIDT